MTDPARLLDSSLHLESRRAIEAAVADEPPCGAKAQLWGTLLLALPAAGVLFGATTTSSATAATAAAKGTAAVGTAASATAATAAAKGTAAVGAATSATVTATAVTNGTAAVGATATVMGSTGLGMLAGKAVAIGLGVGLAFNVAGGAAKHLLDSKPAASVSAVTTATTAAGIHSPSRALAERLQRPVLPVRVGQAEFSAVTARNTPSTTAAKQLPADELSADELREESALLVRTREALYASEVARATELIAEHRQRFSGGKLVQERDALEVQALAKAGQLAAAQLRARAFLLRYPESPHAEKIRAIVGASGEPAQDR